MMISATPIIPSDNDFSARTSEIAPATLSLLHALASSLEKSQRALLARDVAGIDAGTDEQLRLTRALAETEFANGDSSQVFTAAQRVLFLGRVSAALLRRAKRSHAALSHLLTGPAASYSGLFAEHESMAKSSRLSSNP